MVHVVLAGGGTAGHTSPLIATAEALRARGATVSAIGTPKGLEGRVVPAAGIELDMIDPVPVPRRPSPELLRVPGRLRRAYGQARAILERRGADVLVGMGGYVSAPPYVAAWRRKLPFVIHEQNLVPGMANRLGVRLGGRLATAFPDTPIRRGTYLGLPMRRAITRLATLTGAERATERAAARAALGLGEDRPTILVSGGSQGARSINAATVANRDAWLAAGIDVLHVWGPKNFDGQEPVLDAATGARYQPLAYVDAMEQAYLASDLMIGRAGAGTVQETAVVGLPAIFVPLPIGNGEQARNAARLVEVGGALLVPDAEVGSASLRERAAAIVTDPARRAAMVDAGHALVPADAAERLADMVLEAVR